MCSYELKLRIKQQVWNAVTASRRGILPVKKYKYNTFLHEKKTSTSLKSFWRYFKGFSTQKTIFQIDYFQFYGKALFLNFFFSMKFLPGILESALKNLEAEVAWDMFQLWIPQHCLHITWLFLVSASLSWIHLLFYSFALWMV